VLGRAVTSQQQGEPDAGVAGDQQNGDPDRSLQVAVRGQRRHQVTEEQGPQQDPAEHQHQDRQGISQHEAPPRGFESKASSQLDFCPFSGPSDPRIWEN
jgi:hypothetical protein